MAVAWRGALGSRRIAASAAASPSLRRPSIRDRKKSIGQAYHFDGYVMLQRGNQLIINRRAWLNGRIAEDGERDGKKKGSSSAGSLSWAALRVELHFPTASRNFAPCGPGNAIFPFRHQPLPQVMLNYQRSSIAGTCLQHPSHSRSSTSNSLTQQYTLMLLMYF